MKRFASLAILSVILAACAPVSSPPAPTLSPTNTPQPTATSQPTNTPEPTATPEGFRESNGSVQVWEGGKWVELQVPDTIWGDKPEGASIVIKDNEAVLHMELTNFQTPDGGNVVDIAAYDKDTGEWKVTDFAVVRSPELFEVEDSRNFILGQTENEVGWGYVEARIGVVGLKVEGDSVYGLFFYKNRVAHLNLNEIALMDLQSHGDNPRSITPGKLGVEDVLEMLRLIQVNEPGGVAKVTNSLMWEFMGSDATQTTCDSPRWIPPSDSFMEWCRNQISKGDDRHIPTKAEIEKFLIKDSMLMAEIDLSGEVDLWEQVPLLGVPDGTWLRFSLRKFAS